MRWYFYLDQSILLFRLHLRFIGHASNKGEDCLLWGLVQGWNPALKSKLHCCWKVGLSSLRNLILCCLIWKFDRCPRYHRYNYLHFTLLRSLFFLFLLFFYFFLLFFDGFSFLRTLLFWLLPTLCFLNDTIFTY